SICSPEKEEYRDLLLAHARLLRDPENLEDQIAEPNERELDFLIQFYLFEDRDLANKYLSALIHQSPQFPTIPVYQECEGKLLLNSFLDRAEVLENKDDLAPSVFLYECAYELALVQEDLESQRFCLEILFDCFQRMHKSSVAFHIGQILLTYLNPEEDADLFAQVVNQIGILSDHLLCFSQAQELFRVSRDLFHKAENVEGMSDALFNLGYSYYYERRFSRALDILNEFREHPRLGAKAKERVFLIHEHIVPEEIQGDRLLEEKKWEEALLLYGQVLSPRSTQKMSRIYRKLGNLAEEKQALQKTTQFEQENYWVFDRLSEIETHFSVFPPMKTDFMA
ncbi:MAG: tetratricopeptide repeat protein, partial [Planctomycetota bacterium]